MIVGVTEALDDTGDGLYSTLQPNQPFSLAIDASAFDAADQAGSLASDFQQTQWGRYPSVAATSSLNPTSSPDTQWNLTTDTSFQDANMLDQSPMNPSSVA